MNTFKLSRFIGIGASVLFSLLGIISFIMIYVQGKDSSFIDFGLMISIIAVGIVIPALLLIFIVKNALQNPKSMIKSLVGIVILGVLFFIAYSMSSDVIVYDSSKSFETVEMFKKVPKNAIKMSDAGLIVMIMMFVLTIVSMVVTSVWRLFK